MSTASRVAFFFVLIISLISTQSIAQELDPALAKEKFQEGMRQIRNHEYQSALEAFEESYCHKPKAIVLFNIAMCQKALFRYSESLVAFKKYLKEAGESPSPDLRGEVKAAIIEIEQLVGKVVFKGAPPNAKIYFDDVFIGKTPLKDSIAANPGRYIARIVAEDGAYMETIVAVVAGAEITVNANLKVISPGPPEPGDIDQDSPEYKKAFELELKKKKFFKIGKITSVSLGLASAVTGIILTSKGNDLYLEAENMNYPNPDSESEAEFVVNSQEALNEYNAKEARLNRMEVGMIISYSAAAVLLTTGLVLTVVDTNRDKDPSRRLSLRVSPSGIIGEF